MKERTMHYNITLRLLTITLILVCRTSECSAQQKESDESRAAARHELFLTTATGLVVTSGQSDKPLKCVEGSVLRYMNPVRGRFNDAETFAYIDEYGQLRMMLSVSLRGNGKIFLEAASVSPEPLFGKLPGFGEWTPEHGGSGKTAASIQPAINANKARSLLIMRRIAGSVKIEFMKREWNEARLLSQPLYRYSAKDQGISDGAIFAFGEANDPEGFLHVWHENSSAEEGGSGTWYWLAAGSTSLPLRVSHDEQILWEKKGFWTSPRLPEVSYVESYLGDRKELIDEEQ